MGVLLYESLKSRDDTKILNDFLSGTCNDFKKQVNNVKARHRNAYSSTALTGRIDKKKTYDSIEGRQSKKNKFDKIVGLS